jgi:hypothetical protein
MKFLMAMGTVLLGFGLAQELKDPLTDIDGDLGRTGAYIRCFDERLEWNHTPQVKTENKSKPGVVAKEITPLNAKTSSQTRCVVAYRSPYLLVALLLGLVLVGVGIGVSIFQIRANALERRELQAKALDRLFGTPSERKTLEGMTEGAMQVLGLIAQVTEALSKLVQSATSIPGAAGIVLVGLGGWLILTALDQEFRLYVVNAAAATELAPATATTPAQAK